jgi:arsenite methyltransferase
VQVADDPDVLGANLLEPERNRTASSRPSRTPICQDPLVSSDATRDHWADWVLARGHATDAEQHAKNLKELAPIRDRVLANARIQPGDVVLDVGAGDGLIAFGALELVGSGSVILSDISQDLLDHDRELALGLGVAGRAEFVRATAQDLSPIPDGSVDVVTTRSVLIYVDDKDRASASSIACSEQAVGYRCSSRSTITSLRTTATSISSHEGRNGSPEDDPMMNFTERDLLRHAVDAGFAEVHVELAVDVEPGSWVMDWDRLMALAPNPNEHTAGETILEALTPEEAERFEAHLRPLVDLGKAVRRSAFAYLRAGKL